MDQYEITVSRFTPKKKYAIGMLVYPGPSDPKWNYLFGACMISSVMKTEKWYSHYCDIIILTPEIVDQDIVTIIKKCFDVHATYKKPLNTEFSFKTNPRWYGVFNKLYFWNKKIFNYEKILILDTDLFILKPSEYISVIRDTLGPVAGCYENGYLVKNKDVDVDCFNTLIPDKYTCYKWSDNKSYYNMVNAGVLSLEPNYKVFEVMIRDLEGGWDKLKDKYKSLRNKKNNFLFPEQEYLTGLFSGFWRSIPRKFISCETTICHYNNHGAKYWDRFPNMYGQYRTVTEQSLKFMSMYKECTTIFHNIVDNLKHVVVDTSVKQINTTSPNIFLHNINNVKKEKQKQKQKTEPTKIKKITTDDIKNNETEHLKNKNTIDKTKHITSINNKQKNNLLYRSVQNNKDEKHIFSSVPSMNILNSNKKIIHNINSTDDIHDIIFALNNINNLQYITKL